MCWYLMIFKLLLLYFIFSMFQETVETVCPPLDGNSPVCFARLVESLLFKKCIFALRKKQKKGFALFYGSTGDKRHRGDFPQTTGPVAGEVSDLLYKILVWKVLNSFYKRHCWSRGGGRVLQAVTKGPC